MKIFEIVFLLLTLCFVVLSKWYHDLSYILIVFTFLGFFAKLIHEYFYQEKVMNLFMKSYNVYYRSLFFVGLIFILYKYPGVDILSLITVIFMFGSIIIHAFFGKENGLEQKTAYIYMQTYILLYFCIPWFIHQ